MAALHLPATVVFLFGSRQLQARVASLQVAIKRCTLGSRCLKTTSLRCFHIFQQ